jgi:hypothetical protein
MLVEEKVKQRISELKKAREEFVVKVNLELTGLNTAIGELENLLVKEEKIEEQQK